MKKSRSMVTRDVNDREVTKRPRMNMTAQDRFHVNPETIPDDVEYAWIVDSVLGDTNFSKMASRMENEGYEPVPASRHPELCGFNPFGRDKQYEGYIVKGGQVLCERSKVFAEEARAQMNAYNTKVMTSLPGTPEFKGDSTMRGGVLVNETSTSKGYDKPAGFAN